MIRKQTEEVTVQRCPEKHTVTVGLTVVLPLPEKIAYPIQRNDYDILCEGEEASNDLRLRDTFLGFSAGALFALVDLIGHNDRDSLVFAFMVLTVAMFLSGLTIAFYLHRRITRHKTDSAYSRLRNEIDAWFKKQDQS